MNKSPRIALLLAPLVIVWCLGLFAYGLALYPDAPYKACNSAGNYCGKTGHLHTEKEYESQQQWQRALLVSFPFGILAGIYLARRKRGASRFKNDTRPG
jgi:hypothetical protein